MIKHHRKFIHTLKQSKAPYWGKHTEQYSRQHQTPSSFSNEQNKNYKASISKRQTNKAQ